jgi:hypothetical protein
LGSQYSRALGSRAGNNSSKRQRTGDGAETEVLRLLRRRQRSSDGSPSVSVAAAGVAELTNCQNEISIQGVTNAGPVWFIDL